MSYGAILFNEYFLLEYILEQSKCTTFTCFSVLLNSESAFALFIERIVEMVSGTITGFLRLKN